MVTGTTLGMTIANVPTVYLGGKLADRVPLAAMLWVSAALFLGTAAWTLFSD